MNILWITNIMLPPLCEQLGLSVPVIGGWMYSSAKRLMNMERTLRLAVATVYPGKEMQKHEVDGIIYYLLPLHGKNAQKYHLHLEPLWKKVMEDFCPDVAHLHGTEFPHGLALIKANPGVKVVVSIQGLVSVIDRYYLGGMSFGDIVCNITFRDIARRDNLWQAQKSFTRRGKFEREIIGSVKHVIGRTSWDKEHIYAINPEVTYHFCNETLRDEFYKHTWCYEGCEKHSIFLSQAGYPVKGLHQVLKALPLVLRIFPDTKVYVAGSDICNKDSLVSYIRRGGYGRYILRQIKNLRLEQQLIFTGALDEKQICDRYLKSNLFLCPSSIENSPNSLGEAQLVGMPCLASYVGGVPDMIPSELCGTMYRFEEVEMLAYKICECFEQSAVFNNTEMRRVSRARHDPAANQARLMEIYREVAKGRVF